MTYRASSLAALGLQNLPLLSILGNISLGSEGLSRGFSTVRAEVRTEVRGEDNNFELINSLVGRGVRNWQEEEWLKLKMKWGFDEFEEQRREFASILPFFLFSLSAFLVRFLKRRLQYLLSLLHYICRKLSPREGYFCCDWNDTVFPLLVLQVFDMLFLKINLWVLFIKYSNK